MNITERFLRYTAVSSASDEKSESTPSTQRQWDMARLLEAELRGLGLSDVRLDEKCCVTAFIPSNVGEDRPVLGFIAHMDVSSASPSENIMPRVVHYEGGDILLNEQFNIIIKESEYPLLARYRGMDLIVTDGTTQLGADDKAGIAEIVTMAQTLLADDSIKHGKVVIAFTPDEEIGRGADMLDVMAFGADFAYTVDGAEFGEISWENFNASSADVRFRGVSVHPGSAKGIMVNAQLVAMEFFAALPTGERPELTDGREGFYMLDESSGSVESAEQRYILRDHDAAKLAEREETIHRTAAALNAKYCAGTVSVEIKETYRNMGDVIARYPFLVEAAKKAVAQAGGEPKVTPIRGGTDGAMLSFRGLPTPNLGTGSHNHHGRMEFAVVQEMERTARELVILAGMFAESTSAQKR